MKTADIPYIAIDAQVTYLPEQSNEAKDRFVFSYTITIRNLGGITAKLLSRHWIITDSHHQVQEVRGEGVVGEQPVLAPGRRFEYSSGTMLTTSVGTMRGSYEMETADGTVFDVEIPSFVLSIPRVLH
jgi:ApaG protein